MYCMEKLERSDREFLFELEKSVSTNPFSDDRVVADRQTAGTAANATFGEALKALLEQLEQRLHKIGIQKISSFQEKDREILRTGVLFHLYHRYLIEFDALIEKQLSAGDDPCKAGFALEIHRQLLDYGFSREDAELYIAIYYQMRRAYYFLDRNLSGSSPCMKHLRKRLWDNVFTKKRQSYIGGFWQRMEDFSTLLLGETGTGKGSAAKAIGCSGFIPFDAQKQCFAESFTRAFIPINLSQYPATLIESELFGHRKGAFTGAVENHDGIFSRCSPHGAIFLDEIGEVSAALQIKLLQVLQERTFSPVGSHERLGFKGRVIAATNRSITALRREGHFRDDFYYRLCSDQITIPPLRQRIQELPVELDHLVKYIYQEKIGDKGSEWREIVKELKRSPGKDYGWPGNVRELEQAIRRLLLTDSYEGESTGKINPLEMDVISAIEEGALSAKELTEVYCKQLYARYKNYSEVGRRAGMDRRTVKSIISTLGEEGV